MSAGFLSYSRVFGRGRVVTAVTFVFHRTGVNRDAPAGKRLQTASLISSLNFQETSMLPTPEQVKEYIAGGLACQHVEVEGDGQHFFATIVSDAFEGKRPIARHQLVYAALGDRMRAEIHALSMKTLTPAEWKPA